MKDTMPIETILYPLDQPRGGEKETRKEAGKKERKKREKKKQREKEKLLFQKWEDDVKILCERRSREPAPFENPHNTAKELELLCSDFFWHYLFKNKEGQEKIRPLFLLLLDRYPLSPILEKWLPILFTGEQLKKIEHHEEEKKEPLTRKR